MANACATALPEEEPPTSNYVIPLCKLHRSQLYRLALNLELKQYSVCTGIATQLSALYLWHCDSKASCSDVRISPDAALISST